MSPEQRSAVALGLASLFLAWLKAHAPAIAEKIGDGAVVGLTEKLVEKIGADRGGIEVRLSRSGSLQDGNYYLAFAISNH